MRPAISVRTALGAIVVLLCIAASAAGGAGAWSSTRRALEQGWHRTAEDVAERTVFEVQRALAPARPLTLLARAQGPGDQLDFFVDALSVNEHVTWLARADADGTYTAATWWPTDQGLALRRLTRRIQDGVTVEVMEERRGDAWVLLEPTTSTYDPRVRPFWLQTDDDGVWFDPYVFQSRQQLGVSFALPLRDAEGALRSVWIADFECAPLSEFLGTLKVGETGRVYLLDSAGHVIAHPDGVQELTLAQEHPDPWLRLWSGSEHTGRADEGLLSAARRFPDESGVPWWVFIVVPEQELYGPAVAQARGSVLLSVLLIGLTTLVGTVASARLSARVRQVEAAMRRVARFDLEGPDLHPASPPIRELRRLARAHDQMRVGLRSFGRYVPDKLVRRLLRSGVEAQVSTTERPASVLFLTFTDFEEQSSGRPPEELLQELSRLLAAVDRAIGGREGTVTQYLGDTTMAFWAPPLPDHARRACEAALEAIGALDWPATAAVNTGTCLVGNIGAADRFAYTVLGDPVNTAARINGLNKVYGTRLLVGEETARTIAPLLTRPVDWVRMKGKVRPVLIHEVLPADSSAETVRAVGAYRRALDLYRRRAFEQAAAAFEATPWPEPMASRARAYAASPPPSDWDGVHTMREK